MADLWLIHSKRYGITVKNPNLQKGLFFFLLLRRQATQSVCDENKDDKGRQRTKVWMAWLVVSCHNILFPLPDKCALYRWAGAETLLLV